MNAIHILAAQPWVGRLGATLLHFLWQGAIVAAIYAAARQWAARAWDTNGRYVLACAALAAMAIAPIVTWAVLRAPSAESAAVTFAAPLPAARIAPAPSLALSLPADAVRAIPRPFLPWVVAFWLTGAAAFSLRLLAGWMFAQRLRSRMVRPAPLEWQRILDRLKARISVSRPVRLLVSARVQAPAAVGWLRPVVLAPVGALAGLPAAQMEALLLHELAHIRRHDYLIHVWQSALEAVFFYHPAVWWISGHMRAERELCCDDIAVSITGDPVLYARALAEVDSAREMEPTVMAANGGSLADRIARLLGQPSTSRRPACGPGAAAALVLLAIAACAVFAQTDAGPQFEVASVKPNTGARGGSKSTPGQLSVIGWDLASLINYAFGLNGHTYAWVYPAWMRTLRYDVVAKVPAGATEDQRRMMLRSLLVERFKLQFHHESREGTVYDLVTAKGGPKLKPATASDKADPTVAPTLAFTADGFPVIPRGSLPYSVETGRGGQASFVTNKFSMKELAEMLSDKLGRPVYDKTGLEGDYSFLLHFEPFRPGRAQMPVANASGAPGVPDLSVDAIPTLFEALQSQLGLKLGTFKAPVDVLVFDDALKTPIEN